MLVAVGGFGYLLGVLTGGGVPGFGALALGADGMPSFDPARFANFANATTGPSSDGALSGTVQSINGSSIVVQLTDGSTVTIDLSSADYHTEATASGVTVKVGSTVVVKVDAGATASPAADATGRVLTGEDVIVTNP